MTYAQWFWIGWLLVGLLFELAMFARMWFAHDPDARTLTNVLEPWIRRNKFTRIAWVIIALALGLHLVTGWF